MTTTKDEMGEGKGGEGEREGGGEGEEEEEEEIVFIFPSTYNDEERKPFPALGHFGYCLPCTLSSLVMDIVEPASVSSR